MSSFPDLIQLLNSFEQYLGDPNQHSSPVNFNQSLLHDEQDSLAWPQIKYIQEWGFMAYLIPTHSGGQLNSLVEPYLLSKLIARRDITTAIALGLSFFAALPIWIAGDKTQQKALGQKIKQGDIGAFALTEEEHGSDLTANEMKAELKEHGWELSGRKWCINFATLSQFITVLCRTHEQGGLLGFSLFLIDKTQLGGHFKPTQKLPTHGVRGLDISGFVLDKVLIPEEGLIGKKQRGLEITYKAFQVSRTMLACASIGGADTALRLAVSFSLQRSLYGKTAYDIPAVKQRLGEQFTQLLIADCTALAMVRACSIMPEKMSLWSAIIKFLIPQMAEDIVEQSAIVMGARAYLRTTEWAVFQKIRRDIQVVSLFDGSSQVNLSLIAGSLLPQVAVRGKNPMDKPDRFRSLFKFDESCSSLTGEHLGLFNHEEDDIFAGLTLLKSPELNPLIKPIREEMIRLDKEIISLRDQKLFDPRSLAAFRLAERYCWIFAASCCLHTWYYNQDVLAEELNTMDWITLAIQLILHKLNAHQSIDTARQETMAMHLTTFYENNRLFSLIPTTTAG